MSSYREENKKIFKFGPRNIHECNRVFNFPLKMKRKLERIEFYNLRIQTRAIDTNLPFFCSEEQLLKWNVSQDTEKWKERLVIKSVVPNLETDLKST